MPIKASIASGDQRINHAAAVGAAICIITQKDKRRSRAAVSGNQHERVVQHGLLTMNITDGVNHLSLRHYLRPDLADASGNDRALAFGESFNRRMA
jgi:hypothetical protein